MDFAIDQEVFDDTGLVLEAVAERYTDDIMARFARSPEGSAVLKQCDRFGWAALIIDLGMRHRGVNVARMHRTDLDQILFEVLPREFTARPEEATEIVKELRAFWRFVQREFEPVFAEDCLALLERSGLTGALRRKLAKSEPAS
jgi:hypothetical protein